MQERRRPAVGHRRRVPPDLLAHGLHLPARRREPGPTSTIAGALPQRRGRRSTSPPAGAAGRRADPAGRADLRRRDFTFLQSRSAPAVDAEADHPVAEHGPLPRRPGRDRPGRLPGRGAVLGRPVRGVRRPGPRRWPSSAAPTCSWTTPAWPTSTTRPSGPMLAERGRRRRAPAPALHPPDQRRARRTGRTGMAVTTHMCRGNFRSSWAAEGGYDFVAEALFSRAGRRRLLPRVRRRAVGQLRAAAVRAAGQDGRARPGHHQARRAGVARTT